MRGAVMENLRTVREKILGLKSSELAALLGMERSTLRMSEITLHPKRPMVDILTWLIASNPIGSVAQILDYWVVMKPRNRELIVRLMRIARKFKKKGDDFLAWESAMREAHPEFCCGASTRVLSRREGPKCVDMVCLDV